MSDIFNNEFEEYNDFYQLQEEKRKSVIEKNLLPDRIKYIAGTDVAYNDSKNKMVGAIVVLNAHKYEVVEESSCAMNVPFPYIPGLFSFREVPPLIEAYKKLKIKPDLMICDAHGIAHPKGIGAASHLGVELDVPTIGCAKKILVGNFNKNNLGINRGEEQILLHNDKIVAIALRTQNNTNPVFVSIGHKVDLQTACNWVLNLCTKYRLPETTRKADHLVNKLLKSLS